MTVWVASREFAGIAEAGGVKNVTSALCRELALSGESVTCFLPLYGCSEFNLITGYAGQTATACCRDIGEKDEAVSFGTGYAPGGVRIVFVSSPVFTEKRAVYTYTGEDERENPAHVKGTGYRDSLFMDVLFQKAVTVYGRLCGERPPDIVHCQDAATALIPVFMKESGSPFFAHTKSIVTIHNAGPCYHHEFASREEAVFYTGLPPAVIVRGDNNGRVEPLLLVSDYAVITTVSPAYARELLQPDNRETDGLSAGFLSRGVFITGITNGIDCESYDPSDTGTSLLPYPYDPRCNDFTGKYRCREWFLGHLASGNPDSGVLSRGWFDGIRRRGWLDNSNGSMYLSYHGRIVHQKGIDVLADAAGRLMQRFPGIRFIAAGQGETALENRLSELADRFPGQFVFYAGYNRKLDRLCTAVSDFAILPSLFEPCGLEDMIAQIFGTVPVANATGGLTKILDGRTGFLYTPDTAVRLESVLSELILSFKKDPERFRRIAVAASQYVKKMYSWQTVVNRAYMPLYREVLNGHGP